MNTLSVDKVRFEMYIKGSSTPTDGRHSCKPSRRSWTLVPSCSEQTNFLFTLGFSERRWRGGDSDAESAVLTPGLFRPEVLHPGHTLASQPAFTDTGVWPHLEVLISLVGGGPVHHYILPGVRYFYCAAWGEATHRDSRPGLPLRTF